MKIQFHPRMVLREGFELAGNCCDCWNVSRASKMFWFDRCCGCSAAVVSELWNQLQVDVEGASLKHLLWTLHFCNPRVNPHNPHDSTGMHRGHTPHQVRSWIEIFAECVCGLDGKMASLFISVSLTSHQLKLAKNKIALPGTKPPNSSIKKHFWLTLENGAFLIGCPKPLRITTHTRQFDDGLAVVFQKTECTVGVDEHNFAKCINGPHEGDDDLVVLRKDLCKGNVQWVGTPGPIAVDQTCAVAAATAISPSFGQKLSKHINRTARH